MNKKLFIFLLFILILIFILGSKLLIHSSCKGSPGIPWWPNSGCDCKGIILNLPAKENNQQVIGGSADYCIGILKEYQL